MSWDDARRYVDWLSQRTGQTYRLLSEAEWEYAARAGSSAPYWMGASISVSQANFKAEGTSPTGFFPVNPFGLADTAGGVWEWVEDCYRRSYEGAPIDGSAQVSEARAGELLAPCSAWRLLGHQPAVAAFGRPLSLRALVSLQ